MINIKKIFIIILILFSFLVVNANVICNDGTTSKKCSYCRRGCCSRHGRYSNRNDQVIQSRNNYVEQKNSSNNIVQKNNNEVKQEEKNIKLKEDNSKVTNTNNSTNKSENKKENTNPVGGILLILGIVFGVRALIKRK